MFHVRAVRTASSANAVQIVRYVNRKRFVVRHIGSARTEAELEVLLSVAQEWIINQTHQLSVFPNETNTNILLLDQCEFLGVHQRFL
jgi:hypothetical protein